MKDTRSAVQAVNLEDLIYEPEQVAPKRLERFSAKSCGRITVIKTEEIDWICAADNYVELHVGNQTHLLRLTLRAVAEGLSQQEFVRISRSIVVNLDRVKEIHSKSHGDFSVVLDTGVRLAGSRLFRKALNRLLKPFS